MRFPLVDAVMLRTPLGLLELPGVRGALFVDAGAAWDGEFSEWRGSTGVGLRIPLGWVTVIRVDFSRTTDFRSLSGSTTVQWGLGWSY
jgi:outer membrane protein assembly factor BamA